MTNPAQWPSFENWSVGYANRILMRMKLLEAPAVFIQRWWRQRRVPRSQQSLCPIKIEKRAYNVKSCAAYWARNRPDPLLKEKVFAWEKLDGTNLGIRCDGAVFGRRQQVFEKSYQKTSLDGILPSQSCIRKVKMEMLRDRARTTGAPTPSLIIYGELMCKPGSYRYDERGMGNRWYAFGAVLGGNGCGITVLNDLVNALVSKGFLATVAPGEEKINIRFNDKLFGIFQKNNIPCAPLVAKGALGAVCMKLEDKLMDAQGLEGVVLVGDGILFKWKTGPEDESKGNAMLTSLVTKYSHIMLDLAGIDKELLTILISVSGNKPKDGTKTNSATKDKKDKKDKGAKSKLRRSSPYDEDTLAFAYASALTKFDSVEYYFCRDERAKIIQALTKEVCHDLEAETPKELKAVSGFVKKSIGRAYGVWTASQG